MNPSKKNILNICRLGHSCVFVKDMAYYLVNRLDTPDLLPDKYIHTFLIRDPKKSVYSLYKMSMNKELTGRWQEISVCIQKSVYPHYKMSRTRGPQVCTHKSMYSLYKELTDGYPEISVLPVQDVHEQGTHR